MADYQHTVNRGKYTDKDGVVKTADWLVDRNGKLLYIFVPHGSVAHEYSDTWPEPTRSWVKLWTPLHVNSASELTIESGLDADHFAARETRQGSGTYRIFWGGKNTEEAGKTIKFWPLYTFAFDGIFADYMDPGGYGKDPSLGDSPGLVKGLWQRANSAVGARKPCSERDLARISSDGPVSQQLGGGP